MEATEIERPTFNMAAACGCLRDCTEEHDVLVMLCTEHLGLACDMDERVQPVLDYELDQAVREHAGGKRVQRIWGDP